MCQSGYPMEVFGVPLVAVPDSSPHPSALLVFVSCVCWLGAASTLPCYMQGSQDVTIDRLLTGQCPLPPSALPRQQCQLQPVPSISSLTERCLRLVFLAGPALHIQMCF
ncbi:hypothetical protein CesoFtcFv8_016924 [Champsocephalus esox]|uniref:Uncharacterized protein n=2 Tax=Champsocephalus TaxID=52236 RepID=A0AAN8D5B2_CHAGU|nr:hypothetical protein CesoFtcFv8_016924 [Champsocephalus esox]KAK5916242.1 hypothetical protein CgunFtcFv8_011245 [Champsocephalus gunnari]